MSSVTAKHIINEPETVVSESLQGLCYANPNLRLLAKEKVIYYANVDTMAQSQVTLISGGGSGHEPGFSGFVGQNGLAANVSGHVFASPSSSQVLAAIERVQSRHGTLVILMNYTGDCLNFGLAVERAKARGIVVEMVSIGDDVAIGRGNKVGRRGLAGCVLAIKIAGAMASQGCSLQEIKRRLEGLGLATLGVGLDHCRVPGSSHGQSLPGHQLELGMGIHNESGLSRMDLVPAQALVGRMMDLLLDRDDVDRSFVSWEGGPVVLLVNQLGGLSLVELNVVVKEAVEYALARGFVIARVYSGAFLTSLNMPGFSLSLLRADDQILEWLDFPIHVTVWPAHPPIFIGQQTQDSHVDLNLVAPSPFDDSSKGIVKDPSLLEAAIRGATDALIKAEPRITEYDTILGDGDCGQTLKTAALAIQKGISSFDLSSGPKTISSIADIIESSVGGTSSAIYCIFLNALATELNSYDELNRVTWTKASRGALKTLMNYTKARVGDRTLMDTLCPFIYALDNDNALEAAQKGAQSTCHLSAQLGRSSYLSKKDVLDSNIPDAGAFGLSELLTGLMNAIQ